MQDPRRAAAEAVLVKRTQTGAHWFYWMVGLSVVNTVLLISGNDWQFFLGLGVTQVSDTIPSVTDNSLTIRLITLGIDAVILAIFAGLGYLASKGARWAFIAGMVLYASDGLLFLMAGPDWLALAFHAFILTRLYAGFQAAQALHSLRRVQAQPATPAADTEAPPTDLPKAA
jgi:hypothetical protein